MDREVKPPVSTPVVEVEKRLAAQRSLDFIKEGMVVGLGSGSTAAVFIELLGSEISKGLRVRAIPTSLRSQSQARRAGIPLTGFDEVGRVDVTVDGADEIDTRLNLVKGGGGALLWEKIVASASERLVIIADSRKLVSEIGQFPLPVEAVPFGHRLVAERIRALGAQVSLRTQTSGRPFLTVENNYILDCSFGTISDPGFLAETLDRMPGVVEHGLFIDLADIAVLGRQSGVEILERP